MTFSIKDSESFQNKAWTRYRDAKHTSSARQKKILQEQMEEHELNLTQKHAKRLCKSANWKNNNLHT